MVLEKTANYFERNLTYMDYEEYLSRGSPIASGVIEGACRHLVKNRFELSGMRWSLEGAESLLRLRAVAENGDWQEYHAYRRKRSHSDLYGDSASWLATSDYPSPDNLLHFKRPYRASHHPNISSSLTLAA